MYYYDFERKVLKLLVLKINISKNNKKEID